MATTIVTSNRIGSGTQISAATDDILFIEAGVIVSATGEFNDAIAGLNVNRAAYFIHGTVLGGNEGIALTSLLAPADDNRIDISKSGSVTGTTSTGVFFGGSDNTLNNAGLVASAHADAVTMNANGNTIFNSGRISALSPDAGDNAIDIQGAGTRIVNTGLIEATGSSATIEMLGLSGDSNVTENHGKILSAGLAFRDIGTTTNTLINTGLISGDIRLGGGDDTFDGRGGQVRNGTVRGEDGNDTYIIDDATINIVDTGTETADAVFSSVSFDLPVGVENITLTGSNDISSRGSGVANTMVGNIGDNRLFGRGGDDVIVGNAGNDIVNGGFGNDTITGDSGDDVLKGGPDSDKLFGNRGEDKLRGGEGNDELNGGNGDDILIGGLGRDRMTGGDGADDFRFLRLGESPNTNLRDKIMDFETGIDVIDLSRLPGGTYELRIGKSFTGTGPSVRVIESAGDTTVLVDGDGDANTDMRIFLKGATGLTASDFIL